MDYKENYNKWKTNNFFDEATRNELASIEKDEKEIEDRFYKDLEFGTAGLRGKLGAGTNRMNMYIISRATQGLADYIKSQGKSYMDRGVAIAYDCRHFSKEFAERAALVLAANNIKAYLFESLRPTPLLSFTVRHLKTASGIVVTASHNPKEYNGYKVYWEDGAQIGQDLADAITENILKIDNFEDIKVMDEKEALDKDLLTILGSEIDDIYVSKVKELALREDIDKDIKVVYTPLNGTGNVLVRRVLRERGFSNISVVLEQENPDPDFTTAPFPNPEDTRAFEYAEKLGQKLGAELLIATDPDCDRLAIMVRNKDGKYVSFNGNQTGAMLVKYIVEARKELGLLPANGFIVKSIVTGNLGKTIAEKYGVKTFESLTGFKNICGKANELEKTGDYKFVFGYEESIGYVTGDFVKDKDGVISSMMLCEAAAYYKKQGKNLIDVLEETYKEFGYYREKQISLVLEGVEGSKRIGRMMEVYRKEYPTEIKGVKLTQYADYKYGKEVNIITGSETKSDIPASNVLKFTLEDGSWYAVRPSGTEPKIKIYLYSKADNNQAAEEKISSMEEVVLGKLHSVK
ncbi:phospho-sugar mutase [Clostridium sp. YIM B02515]|uniref:Phosphoglucomutase n=1 Tax=Clostridium rhizosphaerae TaxID=2803861 RepID=A0ABS1TDV5_9CLOT|nr:phospho-sugar mutase [Clostridium rhizosphaerae]MBL4937558.1 phospho-sugar mutase [Clostridium rhizosphaerae]